MSAASEGGDFSVRVNFARILNTIAAQIYTDQYAFLRENVQNAIDALRMQAQRDLKPVDDTSYRVDIRVAGTECSISDSGIGMSREELINNFWTMGASGKNTAEARAAGCIGTFGIGGFANFGICQTLEVTSRSATSTTAQRTSLSQAAFAEDPSRLPVVRCEATEELGTRGTVVRGISDKPFDAGGLSKYIEPFVRHVREAIFFNGVKISQESFDTTSPKRRPLGGEVTRDGIAFQLFVEGESTLAAEVIRAVIGGADVVCRGYLRLVHGSVEAHKRGFRLCATNVPSRIGVTGWLDCDSLRPTAGRDTLDAPSVAILTRLAQTLEAEAREHILRDSVLLAGHVRLLPDFVRMGLVERLDKLIVELVGGKTMSLGEIRAASVLDQSRRVFYTSSAQATAATEVLGARGHIVVRLSGNSDRYVAESRYLSTFCRAEKLDGLIECIEVYTDLDAFERSTLSELELSIRKLFKPTPFRLVPGKLTLDTPIYWSGKTENGKVIAYVDTRHGEFQKLKPLGYSTFFWSMIETFCREYLGETLKRESLKLFGAGAVDLDILSKANSETWELVLGDIEVSHLGLPDAQGKVHGSGGARRVEVVGTADIAQITISKEGGVVEPPPATDERPASKLLHIVDESGSTGLSGYYLRIPETATSAFGDIIQGFSSFAVVWFANRITWQGSDLSKTAFVFDITLDRFLVTAASYGAMELVRAQVQRYANQLYFLIPPAVQDSVVPSSAEDLIRIQVRHELIDLNRSRSWTSKEPSTTGP